MGRGIHLLLASCVLVVFMSGCPEDDPAVATLPSCNPMRGNRDCTSDHLKYCVAFEGGGRCVACRTAFDCQDDDRCNGIEVCDSVLGCMPGEEVRCDACDACTPSTGRCVAGANRDRDGDGWDSITCGGVDCDDEDRRRRPGASEVCDNDDLDEDCNTDTFGVRDVDNDGYADARCANGEGESRVTGDDCDDTRGDVHPSLAESCDGRDNDCDSATDEGVLSTVYTDADGDGWGVGSARQICTGSAGYAFQRGDCNDNRENLHPGAFRCAGGGGPGIDVCDDDGRYREATCPGSGLCVAQPDGTGVCWPGSLSECADGSDNDGDGLVDASDADCSSPADVSEGAERCNDGIDNDGDELTDFPNDPGCESRFDTAEGDPAMAPVCSNGLDDDNDGTADYVLGTGDPGCGSAADGSERDPSGPSCDNGSDDDEDTYVDFPGDVECNGPLDDNEGPPQCDNGIDDDGDGRTDFIVASNLSDPGCLDAKDETERGAPNAPVCDNGVDDDGDGAADYPGDVGCTGVTDASE